jgi:hypothetical protein
VVTLRSYSCRLPLDGGADEQLTGAADY